MQIKIAIVEEQSLMREGLITLLNGCSNFKVILDTPNILEAFDTLENQSKLEFPDLLLVNLFMPPLTDFQIIKNFRLKYPDLKIVLVIRLDHSFSISKIVGKRSSSFVTNTISFSVIAENINSIMKNGYCNFKGDSKITLTNYFGSSEPKIIINPSNLSKREIEVTRLLCQELTTKEIADKLFISTKTVGCHRENITRKIGVKSVVGVILYALKNKFIS